MANNAKYLKALENTYNDSIPSINTTIHMFKLAMMVSNGFNKVYIVGKDIWESFGQPPAEQVNNSIAEGYIIDLGDTKTLGTLWATTCFRAIQAGCFAATDISDAINLINNDNLDEVLTDREAMVAVSRVMTSGMNAFRDLQQRASESMKGRL